MSQTDAHPSLLNKVVTYANALDKLSSIMISYEDIIFLVLGTYARYPF